MSKKLNLLKRNKMKKIIFSLICLSAATIASAGIIVTKDGTNIENVSKITVSSNEVSYIENGTSKSLPIDQVSAVLYDDGRYEEITSQTANTSSVDESAQQDQVETVSNQQNTSEQPFSFRTEVKEISVFAFGKPIMNFYATDHEYDGATIEYRITSRDADVESTDWIYLGTTPFAFVSEKSYELISKAPKLYGDAAEIMQVNPLTVVGLGAKNAAKVVIDFRISKEGYKTIVVTPIRKVDFSGIFIYLPLNKLK